MGILGQLISVLFLKSRVDRNSQAILLFTQLSFSLTGIIPQKPKSLISGMYVPAAITLIQTSILTNNMNILRQAAGDVKITIHRKGEQPDEIKKDTMIAQISDIMGGEVQNDGGGSPF